MPHTLIATRRIRRTILAALTLLACASGAFAQSSIAGVVRDGSGAAVSLPGSAFLQLTFTSAQAHDANGNSTLIPGATTPVSVGDPQLRSYVLNGDFDLGILGPPPVGQRDLEDGPRKRRPLGGRIGVWVSILP